jgi:hypothetical protein
MPIELRSRVFDKPLPALRLYGIHHLVKIRRRL